MASIEALDGFWADTDNATKIQKEKSILQDTLDNFFSLQELFDDWVTLMEFAEEGDEDSAKESLLVFDKLIDQSNKSEKRLLLSDELDPNNAIVSINAGAGGTESYDWAEMLYRMIVRWAESKKFKVSQIDYQAGDGAGIKSSTLLIEGNFAYGFLKSETGVHRLVRISPFDSAARRHTSFASIFVSPEIDDSIEIDIQDKDIRIDVFRSGGAGGQSVNTTDSAVRITHMPTGIVVTCQNERSQVQNKAQAFKVLRSRLYDFEMEKKRKENQKLEDSKSDIGWGAQIRSYVLHPYKMVKDHRTNQETGNPDKVLDGDLDPFMEAYLRWKVS